MGTHSTARDSGTHLVATPRKARRKAARPKAPLGVVGQVRMALRPGNRLATGLGFLLGGFVPLASYVVAHHEIDAGAGVWQVPVLLVLGGLVYSAKTVWSWGRLAFASGGKALGFCVLLEGTMVTAHTSWLALSALGYLVGINAVATGVTLAVGRPDEKK